MLTRSIEGLTILAFKVNIIWYFHKNCVAYIVAIFLYKVLVYFILNILYNFNKFYKN